jgi:hypothetical protein
MAVCTKSRQGLLRILSLARKGYNNLLLRPVSSYGAPCGLANSVIACFFSLHPVRSESRVIPGNLPVRAFLDRYFVLFLAVN